MRQKTAPNVTSSGSKHRLITAALNLGPVTAQVEGFRRVP